MRILFFLISLAVLSTSFAAAQEIKVLADLKFLENTQEAASQFCVDGEGCNTWATFYLYDATVVKRLSGGLKEVEFKVIYGRHALAEQDMRNAQLTLSKLPTGNKFNAMYQVTELSR